MIKIFLKQSFARQPRLSWNLRPHPRVFWVLVLQVYAVIPAFYNSFLVQEFLFHLLIFSLKFACWEYQAIFDMILFDRKLSYIVDFAQCVPTYSAVPVFLVNWSLGLDDWSYLSMLYFIVELYYIFFKILYILVDIWFAPTFLLPNTI